VHIAQTEVEAFALSRKFLMEKVFVKYPEIFKDISEQSRIRYTHNIKNEILVHKNLHIEMVNKRATYNNINIEQKHDLNANIEDIDGDEKVLPRKKKSGDHTSMIHQRLRERILSVECEMRGIGSSLKNFLNVVDEDFNTLIANTRKMKLNQDKLH